MRALAWLAVLLLAALGHALDNADLTAAAEPVALSLLAFAAPCALRATIGAGAGCAFALLIFGGAGVTIEILPALALGLPAWLFARSLLRPRTPLIARAIAAIDGAEHLADASTRRYALALTATWAALLGSGALLGVASVLHAHALIAPALPAPRLLAAIVAAAAALLFVGEFALRPHLLPQAPRHSLPEFARDLWRVWPDLIEE
jgi:hypothetical protein